MKKAKTKRTRKPKRANRTAMVLVRLTPDERTRMTAEAKVKGLGISAWLRMIALDVLEIKRARK